MAENLQAYFYSENDAEDVRIKLQKLKVDNVLVDHIPDGTDFTVLVPLQGASTGSGAGGIVPGAVSLHKDDKGDGKDLNHIVQFEVEEKDKPEALAIIKENNGYMDKATL
ncbi:hypothetical protein [Salibacterium aidingense]|uniref:hypothetical protein n=1 Tax=Salibacterium aidingense TaxID=384933 RepID=UPI00040FE5FE|nr:hypothetical protein [Salibacterium aidingense]